MIEKHTMFAGAALALLAQALCLVGTGCWGRHIDEGTDGVTEDQQESGSVVAVMSETELGMFLKMREQHKRRYGTRISAGVTAQQSYVRLPNRLAPLTPSYQTVHIDCTPDDISGLKYFPEVRSVFVRELGFDRYQKQLLSETAKLKAIVALSLWVGRSGISDGSMQLLGQHSGLRYLELGYAPPVSAAGLRHLEGLKQLHTIVFGANLGARPFITLAKLPRLKEIGIQGDYENALSGPIDSQSEAAIRSLRERLEVISTDDYYDVHASFVRPFMHMRKVKRMSFSVGAGDLTVADFEALLEMKDIEYFQFGYYPPKEMPEEQKERIRKIISEMEDRAEAATRVPSNPAD